MITGVLSMSLPEDPLVTGRCFPGAVSGLNLLLLLTAADPNLRACLASLLGALSAG